MFGSSRNPAQAYAKVGLETGVIAASPHKLIAMLFEGALVAILKAENHMRAGEIIEKGRAISHAMNIINQGLRASLNHKEGGKIADNLEALYVYMSERLSQAHVQNNPALLQEVYKLLYDLKSAWDTIDPKGQTATASANSQATALT